MLNYDTWMHKNRKQEVKLKENDCDRKKKNQLNQICHRAMNHNEWVQI